MADLWEVGNPVSSLIKRLIKRANRFHTMFGSGHGHEKYKGMTDALNLKVLETVTFATTRFFSLSFDQWKKIYESYKGLIQTYRRCREDCDDDEDETRYQVRGEDLAVDFCGMLDILQPVVSLMIRAQVLAKHWQEINAGRLGNNEDEQEPGTFQSLSVPNITKEFYNMFDLEKAFTHLCNFTVKNRKLIMSREHKIEWEIDGVEEFNSFFKVVCNLPHVRSSDSLLMLLPQNSVIVFKRLKDTLENIVWFGLGNRVDLFVDLKGNSVPEFKESHLVSIIALDSESLDQVFSLEFALGVVVKAKLQEDNLIASFYNNNIIFESLGKEMCISLDVALAAGGCEAIVEGFYGVVTAHKKSGGQGNDVLVERAIVDWSIPDPIICPKTMTEIGNLYPL
ncbi:Hypothetical predicted protein [Paramuricea clavata]|uniref:Uncharacterized protein n=1 Tax=Paramuricea clavata TaxID=317549 RepID=A0A6S7G9Z7_PARCT|nr:Hypothetical predicted protein [Paramuricea clavata]